MVREGDGPRLVDVLQGCVPKLRIDLQDGFEQDSVVIRVNGNPVFERSDVRTSLLKGFAKSVQVDVESGPAALEIAITNRNLSNTLDLAIDGDTYVGVSRTSNGLESIVRAEPFGYA